MAKRRWPRATGAVLFLLGGACGDGITRCPSGAAFDVLIEGGRIIDGSGAQGYSGMVGVCGKRVGYIGPRVRASAVRRIRLHGEVVAPGFIDMLGQSEYALLRDPLAISKITQGVTTEVTGEAESVWPQRPDAPSLGWSSLTEYFESFNRRRPAINLATFVSAGTIRRAVMGSAQGRPSEQDLAKMDSLMDRAMADGALGVSAALLYPPASFFTADELSRLAKRAARAGGSYSTHLRSESDSVVVAVLEAMAIGKSSGAPVLIHHLKTAGMANWGRMKDVVHIIDSARRHGTEIAADVYPYTASSTSLDVLLPMWARGGDAAAVRHLLQSPPQRARVRRVLEKSRLRPAAIRIQQVRAPELKKYQGRTIEEIASLTKQSPSDVILDLLTVDLAGVAATFFSMDEDDLRTAMRRPWVTFGMDAGAASPRDGWVGHPRAFGTFPRVLGRYVREEHVLNLEEAIRRMTSLAARTAHLADRGRLMQGYFADVVVFDAATIRDVATFDEPGLESRGVVYVLVNGTLVIDGGRPTGARPGVAIRRGSP